ncbi:MAG: aspartate kinase [Anaplasma sp.]
MKGILVKKFGGTYLKNTECILRVAEIVQEDVKRGYKLVVVVSAMGNFTDEIAAIARNISGLKSEDQLSEYDVVVSSGEQISCGLLALALQNKNIRAKSLLGWQVPVNTTSDHARARITNIDPTPLLQLLEDCEVVVVAGFQGVNNGRITTLGRGGSDISAVAIAAALKADTCYVYKDVPGVYTASPHLISNASRFNRITYSDMAEMSSSGRGVLHARSVEIAMRHNIRIVVLSIFDSGKGTVVSSEREEGMEHRVITGIVTSGQEVGISLDKVPLIPGIAAVFSPIAEHKIDVDMIVAQTVGEDFCNVTFTVKDVDSLEAQRILVQQKSAIMYKSLRVIHNLAKVSVVGTCMISNPGAASKMFSTLADVGVSVLAVSTSEIKITILVHEYQAELALSSLHSAFALDRESAPCL